MSSPLPQPSHSLGPTRTTLTRLSLPRTPPPGKGYGIRSGPVCPPEAVNSADTSFIPGHPSPPSQPSLQTGDTRLLLSFPRTLAKILSSLKPSGAAMCTPMEVGFQGPFFKEECQGRSGSSLPLLHPKGLYSLTPHRH